MTLNNFQLLHLCSDYAGTPLYLNMVEEIDKKGIRQVIYIPVRHKKLIDKYRNDKLGKTKYYYSYILNRFSRLNYFGKIQRIYHDLTATIDCSEINLTHAHFMFSDGGVAYKLKKEMGIGYIVAIRNTDLNIFIKYLRHLRSFGLKILLNADKIVFISAAYREHLLTKYIPKKYKQIIMAKSVIIPNGADNFWINNKLNDDKKLNEDKIKLIYVGEFSRNKNIPIIIKVVDKIRETGKDVELVLIGQYGNYVKRIRSLVNSRSAYIHSYPQVKDKSELLSKYRDADIFIMPSYYETFGLVYLEAMSQGLPLIYTKGQGFSGYFSDGEIGYAIDPDDPSDILAKINMIIDNYSEMSKRCIKAVNSFSWDFIVSTYFKIYKEVCQR